MGVIVTAPRSSYRPQLQVLTDPSFPCRVVRNSNTWKRGPYMWEQPRINPHILPKPRCRLQLSLILTNIPTPDATILHQPPEFQFQAIFPILPQNLNGISVSGPPFFGERPYPRQFHPVGFTPFFGYFCQFSTHIRRLPYHPSPLNHICNPTIAATNPTTRQAYII